MWINGTIDPKERFKEYLIAAAMVPYFYGYLFYIINIIKNYQKNIKNCYSSIDKVKLSWIRTAIILFFISSAVISISAIILFTFKINIKTFYHILPVCITLFSCLLAYKGYTQPEIIGTVKKEIDIKYNEENEDNGKYSKFRIDNNLIKEYYTDLIAIMKVNKLFKNPYLSLLDLADAVGIPRFYISVVLNKYAGITFYDFINNYRIEEAKRIMRDPYSKEKNIIDIAFESGFNSKASFNRYFKKITNSTPSDFLKQCRYKSACLIINV